MLLRIVGPDFVAGIVRGGACAPILRKHLKGKTLREIRAYCAERRWTVEIIGGHMQVNEEVKGWCETNAAMLERLAPIDIVTAWEEFKARSVHRWPGEPPHCPSCACGLPIAP